MNIAFFGTGEFSKNILKDLLKYSQINIKLVVSQLDKPVGRKQILQPTPVKQFALDNNIEVLQVEKLKDNQEFISKLKSLDLDFIIVVAYGKIIPTSILEIPKYYPINIHGSILPFYRGASPIQESIKNGDRQTGISIMEMSAGMDEGGVFITHKVDIDILDKTPDIFKKFEEKGAEVLFEVLNNIINNNLKPIPQEDFKATYCSKISKEDGKIDFENETGFKIYNKFRSYSPWPGIYTYYNGKKLELTDILFEENNLIFDQDFKLGDIVEFEDHGKVNISILTKGGLLILNKVKLEGKKEIDIKSFLNGNKDFLDYNFIN
ncbi:MAG: methionyl-tRNA formyltransferase [Candidatus Gracilibacteria bacterium]|nr:methionyl-tRNA formyltransferase [Candidatus Gracilibacteria bacterium]